jgi:hypothetical protein
LDHTISGFDLTESLNQPTGCSSKFSVTQSIPVGEASDRLRLARVLETGTFEGRCSARRVRRRAARVQADGHDAGVEAPVHDAADPVIAPIIYIMSGWRLRQRRL